MSFEPAGQPAAIGGIVVILVYPAVGEEPATNSAVYQVEVLDATGRRITRREGNLVPHLTQAQINALLNFMADLRVQAETEILP